MSRVCWLIALGLLQGCIINRGPLQPAEGGVGVDAFGADAFRVDAAIDAFSEFDVLAFDAGVDAGTASDVYTPPDVFVARDAPVGCRAETCNTIDDDCDGLVDEGACMSGGEGCTASMFEGRVYLLCTRAANWDEARAACRALGYPDLAVLRGAPEIAFAHGLLAADTWVGLSDDGGRIPGASETMFWWVDGAAETTYSEDNGGEDCGTLRRDGSFGDRNCGSDYDFMCEAPIASR